MTSKRNYLANLVHFARIDKEMNSREKEYIRKVGDRIGLAGMDVEEELSWSGGQKPDLPSVEVLRYILLVDLFNLMAIDGNVHANEVDHLRSHAYAFGFEREVIDGLVSKLRSHMELGFQVNDVSRILEDAVFKKSTENKVNEKHHQRGS